MVWNYCEIWKSYGKHHPKEPKFCEILPHSARYGMYAYILLKYMSSRKHAYVILTPLNPTFM